MTQNAVELPVGYYGDFTKGRPLFNADIYIGIPDLDPEIPSNQKDVTLVLEDGTSVPVSQPINTGSGGYVSFNGLPARVFVENNHSIKVLSSSGSQIYFFENVFGKPAPTGTNATLVDTVADMVSTNFVIGEFVDTSGYTLKGDGGDNAYEIVSGETGTADDLEFIDLNNGNQAKALFPGGKVTGPQAGMIPNVDSTTAYNNAAAYITANSLELDLLGKTYIYNIAVSAVGVTIDGFDNWRIHNGTLNRTSVFSLTEGATINKVLNCDCWSIDLNVIGPPTVFGGGSIGTETNKGYLVVWVEGSCENFAVDIKVSDNMGGILTGTGPATTADKSIKNFDAKVVCLNNQYGVNCANRGDNATVNVIADKSHRGYFVYGVDNHDINITTINPGTVTALINSYDSDTTNIRGACNINYTGDAESRGTQNGGVDITTIKTATSSGTGKIDGIDLKVFARSGAFGPNNYRPVVGFQSDTISQRIQNVSVEVDIEGWEGNNASRPPVGYIEQTGYDGSGNPVFTGTSVEPIFDNIAITGRISNVAAVDNNVELSTSLLEGKMRFNIDGSGFLRVRNHSSDPSARIDAQRGTFKNASGGSGASVDYAFMATSLNTWIGKSYNENIGTITIASQVEYQREDRTFFQTLGSQVSPVVVPVSELMPVNFKKYTLEGFSFTHVFTGILQVKTTAGVIDSTSAMLMFESTLNGGAFAGGNISVTGVAVGGGGFLEITFASAVNADLDFISFTLSPQTDIGDF